MSQLSAFEASQMPVPSELESQEAQILHYLRSGRPLTQLDAVKRFGCLRLGARIYDLRREGHAIKTTMSRVSKNKKVAVYTYENHARKN